MSKLIIYSVISIFRGWKFTKGIDDMETECGLDDLAHDIVLDNSEGDGKEVIRKLLEDTSARTFISIN